MIRGRYYMNPAMGAAIENARALADASQLGSGPNDAMTGDATEQGTDAAAPTGAIHRIEIEVAGAPSGSSRSGGGNSRGYVARVHRETIEAAPTGAHDVRSAFGVPSATPGIAAHSGAAAPGFIPRGVYASAPESHVFTSAGDLVNFLRDTLAED